MKAVQQILYKHFKKTQDVNILYIKSNTDYEKSLLELPFSFLEVPSTPLNSCGALNFDFIISQGQQQLQDLLPISNNLHIPIIHIEYDYFGGKPGLFAHEYIFPWNTQAHSWNKNTFISPTVTVKPNTNTRDLKHVFLDVDQNTQQIGQIIAQKYPIKQIKADVTDFSECGLLVNLVANPSVQFRMLQAFSHGTTIVTWNAPYFQEIILDKQTGFLCNNAEELIKTVDELMSNPARIDSTHKIILSLAEAKFNKKMFADKWKQIINKWSNKVYKGAQT